MAKMCCLGSNNKMTMTIRETVDYLRALDSLTAQLPRSRCACSSSRPSPRSARPRPAPAGLIWGRRICAGRSAVSLPGEVSPP